MSKRKLLPIKTPVKIGFLAFLGDLGGCGVLRTVTPYLLLNHLNLRGISINTTYLSHWIDDFSFIKNFSFVQFQRSATEHHLRIHRTFRNTIQTRHRVPLVYEIDDSLMDIPEWNFAHSYYKDNIHNIETMMRESNAIVVSTYPLKKAYKKYNKNVKVVPNHLAKFIWGDIEVRRSSKKPRILWAGSQNHFKHPTMKNAPNGGDFGDNLMNFIRNTVNDYKWVFMGALPIELDDIRDKIEFHNWVDTWHYPQYVKRLKADIGIAPLENNTFNEKKSNIKALEFTAMGMPGIYSNVIPYNNMTIKCESDGYLIDRIEALTKDVDMREEIWNKDYNILKDQLWWEENDNLKKYVNTYLSLMGRKLP
jgi:hypothetical protein